MLQPSLSGNARISVICTINPDTSAVTESTSTLLFAQRIKKVQLSAQKKEVVDTDALIERYRKEIEDLKKRLSEREQSEPVRSRRLSAREVSFLFVWVGLCEMAWLTDWYSKKTSPRR